MLPLEPPNLPAAEPELDPAAAVSFVAADLWAFNAPLLLDSMIPWDRKVLSTVYRVSRLSFNATTSQLEPIVFFRTHRSSGGSQKLPSPREKGDLHGASRALPVRPDQ